MTIQFQVMQFLNLNDVDVEPVRGSWSIIVTMAMTVTVVVSTLTVLNLSNIVRLSHVWH